MCYRNRVVFLSRLLGISVSAFMFMGCSSLWHEQASPWKSAVDRQTSQLGFKNWIVVAEASFPAFNRAGVKQLQANEEIPEALRYVLQSMEQTQHVKPNIYLTRELRSVDNDDAPGIEQLRERLKDALMGAETTQLDQDALLTIIGDSNRSYDVLVIRTTSAMPYGSVFIELQPGYWDAEAEQKLRDKIKAEKLKRITNVH